MFFFFAENNTEKIVFIIINILLTNNSKKDANYLLLKLVQISRNFVFDKVQLCCIYQFSLVLLNKSYIFIVAYNQLVSGKKRLVSAHLLFINLK